MAKPKPHFSIIRSPGLSALAVSKEHLDVLHFALAQLVAPVDGLELTKTQMKLAEDMLRAVAPPRGIYLPNTRKV